MNRQHANRVEPDPSRVEPAGGGAGAGLTIAGNEALDALPYPAVVVELGTAAVLFANRAATAAAPLLLPAGAGHRDNGDGIPHGRAGPYMTDERGERLAPGDGPLARAARGEEFSEWRVAWHAPGDDSGDNAGSADARRHAAYLVSARRVTPPGGGAFGGAFASAFGRAGGDGSGSTARPGAAVVSFIDVTSLESAEAELREGLRARDEFVSVATHELKEPLSSILLSLQLLQMIAGRGPTVPSEEVVSAVGIVRRQGDRLARLIENLLDVSRINNGRLHIDPEAVDVCELVRECVEQTREDARRAGSTLTVEDACGTCVGSFDRLRLEQVVSNLLSNAVKYGAGRPIIVRLDATPETAVVRVADQGIGIAPADHGRVFERFERATDGHLRRSLGLGLYIVRSVVEAHGGTVRLDSDVGRGSTFTVELPRHRPPDRGGGEP